MLTCPFCGAQCAPGERTCLTCGSTLAPAPEDQLPLVSAADSWSLGADDQLADLADADATLNSPSAAVYTVAWWRLAMLGVVVCLGLSAAALLGFTGLLGNVRPAPTAPPVAPATASSGAVTVPATDSTVTAPAGITPTKENRLSAPAFRHGDASQVVQRATDAPDDWRAAELCCIITS